MYGKLRRLKTELFSGKLVLVVSAVEAGMKLNACSISLPIGGLGVVCHSGVLEVAPFCGSWIPKMGRKCFTEGKEIIPN